MHAEECARTNVPRLVREFPMLARGCLCASAVVDVWKHGYPEQQPGYPPQGYPGQQPAPPQVI